MKLLIDPIKCNSNVKYILDVIIRVIRCFVTIAVEKKYLKDITFIRENYS